MHAGNQFISKVSHIEITLRLVYSDPRGLARQVSWRLILRSCHFLDRRESHFSAEIWKGIARQSKTDDCKNERTETHKRSIESSGVARVGIGTQNGNGEREAAYWSRLVCISVEYTHMIPIVKIDIRNTFACIHNHEMLDMTLNQRKHAHNEVEHRCNWRER